MTSTSVVSNGGAFYSVATGTTTVSLTTVSVTTSTASNGGLAYLTGGDIQLTSNSLTT